MKIEQIRNFYEICQTGSFRQAAKKLYISQEGLSYQIRQMEHELGYSLFSRNNQKIEITSEGKIWERAAADILKAYDQAGRRIREQQAGTVILRTWVFVNDIILDSLDEYHKEYPNVRIITQSEDTEDSISKLKDGKIDVLYLNNDILAFYPEISFLPFCPAHEGFLISEQNPLAAQPLIHFSQLNGTPVIISDSLRKTSRELYDSLLCRIRTYCPDSEILYGDDFAGCHNMARYGTGIAVTSFPDEAYFPCRVPGCRLIPHEPVQDCFFGIAYMEGNQNKELPVFLKFQKDYFPSGHSRL